jgi:hypothetical protein
MLIPLNNKLKHWILACIDFEQKWMAWLDSIGDTHEQETRLLFAWLTKEHSINRQTIFNPAEWSLHTGRPPGMQVPLQSNGYDCGIFICLYAAFLDMRLPLSFSQHDTRNVRMWMAHEMIEEGKILKMSHSVSHDSLLATARDKSKTKSENVMASNRSPESGEKSPGKNGGGEFEKARVHASPSRSRAHCVFSDSPKWRGKAGVAHPGAERQPARCDLGNP